MNTTVRTKILDGRRVWDLYRGPYLVASAGSPERLLAAAPAAGVDPRTIALPESE